MLIKTRVTLLTVTHQTPWRRIYPHEWQEPNFPKCNPSVFSPAYSKEAEGFTFGTGSLGRRSEQNTQGVFGIIRVKQAFTPGNLPPVMISAGVWATSWSFRCHRKVSWHSFLAKVFLLAEIRQVGRRFSEKSGKRKVSSWQINENQTESRK